MKTKICMFLVKIIFTIFTKSRWIKVRLKKFFWNGLYGIIIPQLYDRLYQTYISDYSLC